MPGRQPGGPELTWLVTGGAGYIGGHVVRAMCRAGYRVVVLDDLSTGTAAAVPVDVPLVRAAMTDAGALRTAMDQHGVRAVIHMAARKSANESVLDPLGYFRQNVDGTLALVEAMAAAEVRRIVLASSAAVYGCPEAEVVDEDAPTRPINPYGETKLACEWIVRDAAAAYGLQQVCLRYFNVAGAVAARLRDRGGAGLIPRVLAAVAAGGNPVVYGRDHPTLDGSCVRDFVHAADVAAAHVLVARALDEGGCGPVYNVGSGVGHSVLQVLDAVREVTGTAFSVETAARQAADPPQVVACTDRIAAELGWSARHPLPAIVRSEWRARLAPADGRLTAAPADQPGLAPANRALAAASTDGPGLRPADRPGVALADQALPAASESASPTPSGRGRVVVLSASVGAGHDGAAAEWARRLREHGFDTDVLDFLTLLPRLIGRNVSRVYQTMLRRAPWSYSAMYGFAAVPGCRGLVNWLMAPLSRRLLRRLPDDTVAVLSTYPLASQLAGRLRRLGRLGVPAVTFLTDFSVHWLWVGRGIDMHCAVHPISAEQARRFGAAGVTVSGPLVDRRFGPGSAEARRQSRERFGLPVDGRLALLVAGSWGVGAIDRAAAEIASTGVAAPVVVCGSNVALRDRLARLGLGHPLGWVDDMPGLMHAVDVLVENAGGLTSLEAMASGLPIATYRPIPGHGRANAATLDQARVSTLIRDRAALPGALAELMDGPRGRHQRATALELFAAEPTGPVVAAALRAAPAVDDPISAGRRWLRWAAAVAVLLVMLNATVGTRLAVAHGLQSVRPRKGDAVFLVVHPGPQTRIDTETVRLLGALRAGVAVDKSMLSTRPEAVRTLAQAGVTLLNAGSGPPYETGIVGGRSVIARNAATMHRLTGTRPAFYLSGRNVDAVDVGTVSYLGEDIVQPGLRINAGAPVPPLPTAKIVLVECGHQLGDLVGTLRLLAEKAAAQGIRLDSLTVLDQ